MERLHVGCRVLDPATSKGVVVRRLLVDTSASSTWIDGKLLESIGIAGRKTGVQFQLANGEVVFAEEGDLQRLGARALAGLRLNVDSRCRKLVDAGPGTAAAGLKETRSREDE
ncbi:MAG: aspartyl protease family protein [Bryobacteraceae bacterium]